jgi:TolB-like protein
MLKRQRFTHRFIHHSAAIFLTLVTLVCFAPAHAVKAQKQAAADVVIVLPFENRSNRAEYNWVGETFADSLADLLNLPGLTVVSSDERELAYQRVRLPNNATVARRQLN